MCEEYESLHDTSVRPDMVMGQSIVLSEIKTEVPLENDDPAHQNLLLQRYEERIKSLSQTDRVSKFCMDAGVWSEKLKTVLELYDLETHQKKLGPDYHRLKTMVKRSIEQDIRNKNFGARNGNYERNAVVKNQGAKQRVQRILVDCWQWETNGQCVKGDNCSFRHDVNKRGKITPSNPSPNSFMQQK